MGEEIKDGDYQLELGEDYLVTKHPWHPLTMVGLKIAGFTRTAVKNRAEDEVCQPIHCRTAPHLNLHWIDCGFTGISQGVLVAGSGTSWTKLMSMSDERWSKVDELPAAFADQVLRVLFPDDPDYADDAAENGWLSWRESSRRSSFPV